MRISPFLQPIVIPPRTKFARDPCLISDIKCNEAIGDNARHGFRYDFVVRRNDDYFGCEFVININLITRLAGLAHQSCNPSPALTAGDALLLIVIVQNKLIPMWVIPLNKIDFPLTWPTLHRLLLRDGIRHKIMPLKPDEARSVMPSRKAFVIKMRFVLLQSSIKVFGYAQINSAVLTVAEQINIAIGHRRRMQEMGCKIGASKFD